MPQNVNDQGCCCDEGCYVYIPCCVDHLSFFAVHQNPDETSQASGLNVTELTMTAPGIITADWAIGDTTGSGGIAGTPNIYCHHTDLDPDLLICPSSGNAVVQITMTLRNCSTSDIDAQIAGAGFRLGFWTGGDPANSGIHDCELTQSGPDRSTPNAFIKTFTPNESNTFTWTMPLPIEACPARCISEEQMAEWIDEHGSIPEVVTTNVPGWGNLQRICYRRACRDDLAATIAPGDRFFDACFGAGNCQDDDPLVCPDCYWIALTKEEGSNSVLAGTGAGYGADIFCHCSCSAGCTKGFRNNFCPQPMRSVFGGSVWSGTATICAKNLLEPGAIWEARDNSTCLDGRSSSFAGPEYISPVGSISLLDDPATSDQWFDLNDEIGADPCKIVTIEWSATNTGGDDYDLSITIDGINLTDSVTNPTPAVAGDVWWLRDHDC